MTLQPLCTFRNCCSLVLDVITSIRQTIAHGIKPPKRGRGTEGKTIVMGMKQHGGPIRTVVIPNVKMPTLRNVVLRNVKPGSVVSTDELMSYGLLTGDGYVHGTVTHSEKIWRG